MPLTNPVAATDPYAPRSISKTIDVTGFNSDHPLLTCVDGPVELLALTIFISKTFTSGGATTIAMSIGTAGNIPNTPTAIASYQAGRWLVGFSAAVPPTATNASGNNLAFTIGSGTAAQSGINAILHPSVPIQLRVVAAGPITDGEIVIDAVYRRMRAGIGTLA